MGLISSVWQMIFVLSSQIIIRDPNEDAQDKFKAGSNPPVPDRRNGGDGESTSKRQMWLSPQSRSSGR